MAEFMIVYHFLSTFTRYLFEFDKSLLKGVSYSFLKAWILIY